MQRILDGNVVVIDDISTAARQYLVDMNIRSLTKDQRTLLAAGFEDAEDRQKGLRSFSRRLVGNTQA